MYVIEEIEEEYLKCTERVCLIDANYIKIETIKDVVFSMVVHYLDKKNNKSIK